MLSLRVEPGARQGDGLIRDLVRNALVGEPALAENDAWCMFGLDHVVNGIAIRP
jgi:hypothetical protein